MCHGCDLDVLFKVTVEIPISPGHKLLQLNLYVMEADVNILSEKCQSPWVSCVFLEMFVQWKVN